MKKSDKEVVLYTIQSPLAVKQLTNTGELFASKNHIEPDFLEAYLWIRKQMVTRLTQPNRKNCMPLWAWHAWEGSYENPCDLRSSRHVMKGKKAFRIKFKKK